jgi:hypothetical protein
MNSYPQELSTGRDNLWTTRRSRAQVVHILISNLTLGLPSRRGGEPVSRLARSRFLVVTGLLCVIGITSAYPSNAVNNTTEIYKLYAHTKLLNAKEFHCVDLLWTKESQWNSRSKNKHSTAFGIPQLLKMKERNPFKQIDLGLRYIHHRHSTPCKAWEYWKKKGHY